MDFICNHLTLSFFLIWVTSMNHFHGQHGDEYDIQTFLET